MLRLLLLSLALLAVLPRAIHAQAYEKANAANTGLSKLLHTALSSGDTKAIRAKCMNATELLKAVGDHLEGNIDAQELDGLRQHIRLYGRSKDIQPALDQLVQGGKLQIDWTRVYLKRVWQTRFVSEAGLTLYAVVAQFNHGAQTIWLQLTTAQYNGETRFWGLKNWNVKRDGVINIPVPESSDDVSAFTRLKESLEIEIDLTRFPSPMTERDLGSLKTAVKDFKHATSARELGVYVFNLCVTGDFKAAGRALLPAGLNSKMENLSQAQFEVLAALDAERLYANSMAYWQFHWQDSILKSVESNETMITVVFDALLQPDHGKTKTVEMEFNILRPHHVQGKWYLSSHPEYPTGITPVSMERVLIDVSNLVQVSGIILLDGKPLANAVVNGTPAGIPPNRSRAERGLNSRIPSAQTDAIGQFLMTVTYNTFDNRPVIFKKIPLNRYIIGVYNAPSGKGVEPDPLNDPVAVPGRKNANPNKNSPVPEVFANPFTLESTTKYLHVQRELTTVLIKLTSQGTIEVIADAK